MQFSGSGMLASLQAFSTRPQWNSGLRYCLPPLLAESRLQCNVQFPRPAHAATLQVAIADVPDHDPMRLGQLCNALCGKPLRQC